MNKQCQRHLQHRLQSTHVHIHMHTAERVQAFAVYRNKFGAPQSCHPFALALAAIIHKRKSANFMCKLYKLHLRRTTYKHVHIYICRLRTGAASVVHKYPCGKDQAGNLNWTLYKEQRPLFEISVLLSKLRIFEEPPYQSLASSSLRTHFSI